MRLKSIVLLLTILMMFSGITSTVYADDTIRSIRIVTGDPAPFSGTLYNEAGDREINLVLLENEEYEQALMDAVNKKNVYKTWAFGATITTILAVLLAN